MTANGSAPPLVSATEGKDRKTDLLRSEIASENIASATTPQPFNWRAHLPPHPGADAHIAEVEAAREYEKDLAGKLRMAEIKIVELESEIADLKRENAELRKALDDAKAKEAAS